MQLVCCIRSRLTRSGRVANQTEREFYAPSSFPACFFLVVHFTYRTYFLLSLFYDQKSDNWFKRKYADEDDKLPKRFILVRDRAAHLFITAIVSNEPLFFLPDRAQSIRRPVAFVVANVQRNAMTTGFLRSSIFVLACLLDGRGKLVATLVRGNNDARVTRGWNAIKAYLNDSKKVTYDERVIEGGGGGNE